MEHLGVLLVVLTPLYAPFGRSSASKKSKSYDLLFLQLNPPVRVGEIIFDDEIPHGNEIRLDGGWWI